MGKIKFNVADAIGYKLEDKPKGLRLARLGETDRGREMSEALLDVEVAKRVHEMEVQETARYQRAAANWKRPTRSEDILTQLKNDRPPVRFVVEGLAPHGSNVLLVAEAKAGKTTLVMNLVTAMVQGRKFLGRYAIGHLAEGTSITYSNFELAPEMAEEWLERMGIADDPVTHRHKLYVDHWRGYSMPLPALHVEDALVEDLRSRNSSVWVIDPYGAAISHDENSNDDTRAWTSAIDRIARRAGLALVVIAAHSGSSAKDDADLRARGAYRLEDWMSVKWSYSHGGEVNQDPPDNLRYLKARGRDVSVPQFTVDYDAASRRLTLASETSNKASNAAERWALKVYEVVRAHHDSAAADGETGDALKLKAGALSEALGVSRTDSKPGGSGQGLKAGRQMCVGRGWVTEEPGPRNSKLYGVGDVDPYAELPAAVRSSSMHIINIRGNSDEADGPLDGSLNGGSDGPREDETMEGAGG